MSAKSHAVILRNKRYGLQSFLKKYYKYIYLCIAKEVKDRISGVCLLDSGDDKFIECAIAASDAFIVSGDSDLLEIKKYRSVCMHNDEIRCAGMRHLD